MDAVFIALAAGLWLAAVGLAIGCMRLQGRGGRS
jgi:hypothetical protein